MKSIQNLEDLLRTISFDLESKPIPEGDNKLLGIMFCRPQLLLAKLEILPSIEYFHVRSNHFVDFYFPGFTETKYGVYSYEIKGPEGRTWFFNEIFFIIFVEI